MKLVMIADLHSTPLAIESGDVLIIAGDMTHFGQLDEIKEMARWINRQPHTHKVVVGGNHDMALEIFMNTNLEESVRRKVFDPAIYLRDSGVTLEGINFWGSPFCPPYAGAFNLPPEKLRARWAMIPGNTDVLITHTPPAGILDGGNGCPELAEAITRVHPKVHCFGHVHEAWGRVSKAGTLFLNVSGSPQATDL